MKKKWIVTGVLTAAFGALGVNDPTIISVAAEAIMGLI